MIRSHSKVVQVIVFAGAVVVALSTVGRAQTAVPGLGAWKLNPAKSKFSPGPAPKSSTVTFTAAGQGFKAVIDSVSPADQKTHWEYTADFDGKPHPVTGNPDGDMVVIKRVNATTVESTYTLKGKQTTVNTRVVSADGKTMTVTTKGTNAQGQKVDNMQFFEKA